MKKIFFFIFFFLSTTSLYAYTNNTNFAGKTVGISLGGVFGDFFIEDLKQFNQNIIIGLSAYTSFIRNDSSLRTCEYEIDANSNIGVDIKVGTIYKNVLSYITIGWSNTKFTFPKKKKIKCFCFSKKKGTKTSGKKIIKIYTTINNNHYLSKEFFESKKLTKEIFQSGSILLKELTRQKKLKEKEKIKARPKQWVNCLNEPNEFLEEVLEDTRKKAILLDALIRGQADSLKNPIDPPKKKNINPPKKKNINSPKKKKKTTFVFKIKNTKETDFLKRVSKTLKVKICFPSVKKVSVPQKKLVKISKQNFQKILTIFLKKPIDQQKKKRLNFTISRNPIGRFVIGFGLRTLLTDQVTLGAEWRHSFCFEELIVGKNKLNPLSNYCAYLGYKW